MSALFEQVSAEMLTSCDIEGPLGQSTTVDCDEFEGPLTAAAKVADEGGNPNQALVYRLLSAICSFHFKPEDGAEPFSNQIGFADGSRTLVGSDFDTEQISALHAVLPRLNNLPLRTRMADLIWSREKRRADCARLAIDGYVELVNRLVAGTATERFHDSDPTGVSSEDFLRRAAAIARATGWNRPENDALRIAIAEVLTVASQRDDMAVVRIGNFATDIGLDNAESILANLPDLVETVLKKPDYFVAESVQRLIIRRAQRARDDHATKAATLKLISIFEAKAEATDSAMLKAHALQEAIESLHGLKGVRDERQRIHDKLKDAQLHMYEEFGKIEQSVDLTSEVERLLSAYDGLHLLDALLLLARTEQPKNPDKLIKAAQDEAQKFPLSSLFATSLLDSKGRTVARTGGGIESEDGLRHKIIRSESIRIGLAVGGAIKPQRQRITERYAVDYDLLYQLCLISPFVPSGSEHAFAKGIEAFLFGDEFVATASLAPLLEAGLRALVEVAGRSDTKISAEGIEETIGLGLLLSDHRDVLETVFGKGMIFAIENLFAHELGPKIRHSFCHGLARDGSFYSDEYIYGNKIIFSLVILPLAGSAWDAAKAQILGNLGRPSDFYAERVVELP